MKRKMGMLQRAWRAFATISIVCVAFFFIFAQSRDLPSGAPCLFRSFTGVPCLMCGGTRAFFALSQGRLADSWYFNPLVFPFVMTFGCICILWTVEALLGRAFFSQFFERLWRGVLHPLCVPIFLLGLLLLWTWRVADAVVTPKPELLLEGGVILKIFPSSSSGHVIRDDGG